MYTQRQYLGESNSTSHIKSTLTNQEPVYKSHDLIREAACVHWVSDDNKYNCREDLVTEYTRCHHTDAIYATHHNRSLVSSRLSDLTLQVNVRCGVRAT